MGLWFTLALILGLTAIMRFAWVAGGEPERCVVLIILIAYLLSIIRMAFIGLDDDRLDIFGLLIDVFTFAGVAYTALYAIRIWPIWAASLQLLAIFAHLVRIFEIDIDPIAYGIMRSGPTYFVWIALLIGTCLHHRREQSGARRPSWRNWSQRSNQPTLRR